jgi:hypothetical protein
MVSFLYLTIREENALVWYRIDPSTGELDRQGAVDLPGHGAGIGTDPACRTLFVATHDTGRLCSFQLDSASGAPQLLHTIESGLVDPAYIATDVAGRFLIVPFCASPSPFAHLALSTVHCSRSNHLKELTSCRVTCGRRDGLRGDLPYRWRRWRSPWAGCLCCADQATCARCCHRPNQYARLHPARRGRLGPGENCFHSRAPVPPPCTLSLPPAPCPRTHTQYTQCTHTNTKRNTGCSSTPTC